MLRLVTFVAALWSATVGARECDAPDVLPLATDLSACITVSKLSLPNATVEDFQRACVYDSCRNLIRAMGALDCTLNNEPVSIIGSLCDVNATKTCSTNDTAAFAPHLKQCQLLSGVSSVTTTTAPTFCKYAVCVQYTKLFAPLSCTVSGVPAATIARFCDNAISPRPPATSPSITTNSTTECSLDDTPLAYPDQLRQCLIAANLKVPPAGPSDWLPLCEIDPCSKAVRYFAGLSCTVGGTPASTLAKVCGNIIPLTTAPTTTNSPAPVVASGAVSPTIAALPLLATLVVTVVQHLR